MAFLMCCSVPVTFMKHCNYFTLVLFQYDMLFTSLQIHHWWPFHCHPLFWTSHNYTSLMERLQLLWDDFFFKNLFLIFLTKCLNLPPLYALFKKKQESDNSCFKRDFFHRSVLSSFTRKQTRNRNPEIKFSI